MARPAVSPAINTSARFIDASFGSVVGCVLEVHGVAERQAPVPAMVLPDLCMLQIHGRGALAEVLLGGGHVDRDAEGVRAPVGAVALGAACIAVDPVPDV